MDRGIWKMVKTQFQRRRIKTEEKTKVVAAVWGTEMIKFLTALAIVHQYDLKKGMSSSYSSYTLFLVQFILFFISSWCNSSYSSNSP